MPPLKPIKRKELIRYLRKIGFKGPYSGGRHQFMQKEKLTLTLPNPHKSDIGPEFLSKILKQANITRDEWEKL
ncbi:MAG: type II toxin-antitoxin system HicA family toxin [Spirochaetia bacterium]|nr:type II toxin-antitoxin system HicA family toxin [Spirochaetia bacterium]